MTNTHTEKAAGLHETKVTLATARGSCSSVLFQEAWQNIYLTMKLLKKKSQGTPLIFIRVCKSTLLRMQAKMLTLHTRTQQTLTLIAVAWCAALVQLGCVKDS
jgi:hypothetical protein